MRAKRMRLGALCAAAVALAAARFWLYCAPGHAVRWGSRIAGHDFTGRGSRGSITGRGSRGFSAERGLRRFTQGRDARNARLDPRDPRPVLDPRDPRPVLDPRDPRPVIGARIRDLSNAVIAVGVRRPFSATCLEQSVALVMLLSIARIPAHLVVGVTRAEPAFRAHAWVECGGAVVLGADQAQGLTPLLRTTRAASPSTAASSCPG